MPLILGKNGLFSELSGAFDKLGVTSSSLVSSMPRFCSVSRIVADPSKTGAFSCAGLVGLN